MIETIEIILKIAYYSAGLALVLTILWMLK
jgi:hypothetical protein